MVHDPFERAEMAAHDLMRADTMELCLDGLEDFAGLDLGGLSDDDDEEEFDGCEPATSTPVLR